MVIDDVDNIDVKYRTNVLICQDAKVSISNDKGTTAGWNGFGVSIMSSYHMTIPNDFCSRFIWNYHYNLVKRIKMCHGETHVSP